MTRFMWWTVVWFGMSLLGEAVYMHFAGGFDAYRAHYTPNVNGLSALTVGVLYIWLWFSIVKKEP